MKKSRQKFVTQAFTCISYVYTKRAQTRPYTVYRQGGMVDGKDDVIKWRQIASRISAQWIVAE